MLLLLGITSIVIVLFDQVTKFLAFRNEEAFTLIKGVIDIVHARNDGVAFGIGGGMRFGSVIWISVSIFTIALLFGYFLKYARRTAPEAVAFGLIIGGAFGNLIDRIRGDGHVLDFIKLRFINWPAFNIADAAIVIGVILMVFTIAFEHAETQQSHKKRG